MRKKLVLSLFALVLAFSNIFAQQPAKWDFKTKKINDSISELVMQCSLSGDWHIYSQHTKGTENPIKFTFEENGKYIVVDYKTDFVEDIEELRERYSAQLNMYKRLLSESLGKEVVSAIIWSFRFGKELEV